jgi:hypothetical protein
MRENNSGMAYQVSIGVDRLVRVPYRMSHAEVFRQLRQRPESLLGVVSTIASGLSEMFTFLVGGGISN